jgi:hypothetical protein
VQPRALYAFPVVTQPQKSRKSPLFALITFAAIVLVWVARVAVEDETPSIFEVLFASSAVWLFYERKEEALDIAISLFGKDNND